MSRPFTPVTIDINKEDIYSYQVVSQEDSRRGLKVTLTNNNVQIKLKATEDTVLFKGKKPDNKLITIGGVINTDGTVDVTLTNQACAAKGILEYNIAVINSADNSLRFTAPKRLLKVGEVVVTDETIISSNEFSALSQAVADMQTYKNTTTATVNGLQGNLNTTNADLDIAESKIATLITQVADNILDIDQNTLDITANKNAISQNSLLVGSHTTEIAKNTSDILNNLTAIARHRQELNDLENKVSSTGDVRIPMATYGVAAIPKNALQAPMQTEISGMTATNLVTNGDFSNGTTGWNIEQGSGSIVGGNLVLTASGATTAYALIQQVRAYTENDVYYVKMLVKANHADATSLQLFRRVSGSPSLITTITTPVKDNIYLLSGTFTAHATTNGIGLILYYASASAVSGKSLTIMGGEKGVICTNLTALGLTTLPKNQLDVILPNHFSGTKSAVLCREVSVGKNLFDKTTIIPNKGLLETGVLVDTTASHTSSFIRVDPNTPYMLSNWTDTIRNIVYYNDSFALVGFIAGDNNGSNLTFTTPATCKYVRFAMLQSKLNTVQLERGTVATSYVPFISPSYRYNEPSEYHRLPNGVCDYRDKDGNKRVRIGKYVLKDSDITLITVPTQVNYAKIEKSVLVGSKDLLTNQLGQVLMPNYAETPLTSYDDVAKIGMYFVNSSQFIGVILNKSVTLAQAKSALAGTVIYYQLAVDKEYTISNVSHGMLMSYPNGTYCMDNVIDDVCIYNNGAFITRTGYPIKELEFIYKYNSDGTLSQVNATTAAIASNKLSFTHTSLSNKDVVYMGYKADIAAPESYKQLSMLNNDKVYADKVNGKYWREVIEVSNGVKTSTLVEVL